VKWGYNLKVSIFTLTFLAMAHVCIFIRCFNQILNAVTSPAFYKTYVKIPTQSTPLAPYNPKLLPFFKGAIGALDGTHISAHPPSSDQSCYFNHKGQNVLAATKFDMHFCYILSGWREVPQIGVSSMMQIFKTWRSQMASTTQQMQAIPFVMHFLCHSMGFSITSKSGKVVV